MSLELNPREAYGQLYFLDNTIESLTGDIDIEIGITGSVADLKFNRNTVLAPGKTFGLVDSVTEEIVRMSVSGGVLDIDGANQLQVGQLKFVDNTIESSTGDIDIQIGLTGSIANLELNRNVVLAKGKSLSLVDHYLDETTSLTVISGSLFISGANQLQIGDIKIYNDTIESDAPNVDIQLGATTSTADLVINRNTVFYSGKTLTVQGNSYYTGSLNITGSGYINSKKILTDLVTSSLATTGSNTFIGDQTITGSLTVSASLNINNGFYVDGAKQFNYASFSDLTTQSGSANTAYPMKLNTTDIAEGFSIVSGSRITAANIGTYNLQFSAQINQTTNNSPEVSIWLRKDGTNVPNTNTELTIEKVAGGGKLVASWNFIVQLNATQYVELVWSSTRSDTQIAFIDEQSTPTRPITPSVIVTMTQIA